MPAGLDKTVAETTELLGRVQLHAELAHLDKRVAVLETKDGVFEKRFENLNLSIREMRDEARSASRGIEGTLNDIDGKLVDHIWQEQKDRAVVLRSALMALIAATGSFAVWLMQMIWPHLDMAG